MFSLKSSKTFGTASIHIHSIDKLSGCFHRLANVKKKLFVCLNDCIKAGGMCLIGCWKCTQTWLSSTSFSRSYFLKHYFQLPAMTRFSSSIWGDTFLSSSGLGLRQLQEAHWASPCEAGWFEWSLASGVVKFQLVEWQDPAFLGEGAGPRVLCVHCVHAFDSWDSRDGHVLKNCSEHWTHLEGVVRVWWYCSHRSLLFPTQQTWGWTAFGAIGS